MWVIDVPVHSPVKERDTITPDIPVPPEPRERFDLGEGPKALFICASTIERCEEILDYIDIAIADIRKKVRIIFCTDASTLDHTLFPVLTSGIRRLAGICLRHHELDSDAFFEVIARAMRSLLPPVEPGDGWEARQLLSALVTFSHSPDTPLSRQSQRRFTDAFLDLYLQHRWTAYELEDIFSSQRLVDLAHPKFVHVVRTMIWARINGEL